MVRTFRTLAVSSPPKGRRPVFLTTNTLLEATGEAQTTGKPQVTQESGQPRLGRLSLELPVVGPDAVVIEDLSEFPAVPFDLLAQPGLAELDDIRIVLERQVQLQHVDLDVVETGQEEPIEVRHRGPGVLLRMNISSRQQSVLGAQQAHVVLDPGQPVRHVAGESSAALEFGSDFVDPLRRGLEPGVVFGVQEAA